MSLDPSLARNTASAPGETEMPVRAEGLPEVERIQIWPLRQGDRAIVHVDGPAGMSAGGADRIGQLVRAALGLDGLGFDVPVLVVSPGIRVEVIRPS